MTCLYLHGYNGSLSDEKLALLQKQYSTVIAPKIDYDTDDINAVIDAAIQNKSIDVFIGSSLGGYVAYYYSNFYSKACLLLNPAFASKRIKEIKFEIKEPEYYPQKLTYMVVGANDELINYQDTIESICLSEISDVDFLLRVHPTLKHQIPVAVFEKELKNFNTLRLSFK